MKKRQFTTSIAKWCFAVLLVLVAIQPFTTKNVSAATKKTTWYVASVVGYKGPSYSRGVNALRIKDNKLILEGTFGTGKTLKAATTDMANKYKKPRTFVKKQLKLSKNVKYYGQGEKKFRYTTSYFKKTFLNKIVYLGVTVKVVNGVVMEVIMGS